MLIDVSHSGDRTTLECDRAVAHADRLHAFELPRTQQSSAADETDEAIRKLAAKGGVMGITGVRNFVKDKEPTTVDDRRRSHRPLVKLVGIEHVGIGTDSDLMGYDHMPPPDQYEKLKPDKILLCLSRQDRHRRFRSPAKRCTT